MDLKVTKIATLTGHSGAIYALDKGNRPELVFSGSSDKFVALWNLQSLSAEKFAAQFPGIVYAICHVSEQNLLLVGTSLGSVHILDLIKKEEIKILQHHIGPIFNLKYSLKTNCFYSVGGDGNFGICSLETISLIKIKKLCEEKIRSIDLNETTKEIAVASGDCFIRIFDLETLKEKKSFIAHTLSANVVRYSKDGTILLSGGRDAHLNVWETQHYSSLKKIPAHNYAIYDIVYSPDQKLFATASRDKTIKIWNAQTFELLVRINKENYEGHRHSVNKLLWADYTNYLISVGDDKVILVWEINCI